MILHIIISYLSLFHPFHISVTEIEFDQEEKALEIAQKLFIDDLGDGLKQKTGESLDLFKIEENQSTQDVVKDYIIENLKIKINEKEVTLEYLGAQPEDDVLWCFIEVSNIKKLKSIEVTNTALTKTFPDQMNLVHIKAFGETQSMRLRLDQPSDRIEY